MKAWTKGAVVVALGFVACRSYTTFPSNHRGLRLTTPQLAKQYGRDLKHVDRPFQLLEQGVNGTGVLMAFFQELEQASGAYVSDVSYALQMTYDGKNIECVSRIRVDDGTPKPEVGAPSDDRDGEPEYTTTVKPWRPRTVDASVVDRDLKCQQHAQQVIEDAPRYDSVYGAETRLYIPPGRMPLNHARIVHYEECTYEPNQRRVHRYEHFVAARFNPPDLEQIRKRYADLPLVQEPPLCHVISLEPGQSPRQHIAADVAFGPPFKPMIDPRGFEAGYDDQDLHVAHGPQ
jgi:hypothetical protein